MPCPNRAQHAVPPVISANLVGHARSRVVAWPASVPSDCGAMLGDGDRAIGCLDRIDISISEQRGRGAMVLAARGGEVRGSGEYERHIQRGTQCAIHEGAVMQCRGGSQQWLEQRRRQLAVLAQTSPSARLGVICHVLSGSKRCSVLQLGVTPCSPCAQCEPRLGLPPPTSTSSARNGERSCGQRRRASRSCAPGSEPTTRVVPSAYRATTRGWDPRRAGQSCAHSCRSPSDGHARVSCDKFAKPASSSGRALVWRSILHIKAMAHWYAIESPSTNTSRPIKGGHHELKAAAPRVLTSNDNFAASQHGHRHREASSASDA